MLSPTSLLVLQRGKISPQSQSTKRPLENSEADQDTVAFLQSGQNVKSSSKKRSYPYELSFKITEEYLQSMAPASQKWARQFSKKNYKEVKKATINALEYYNIKNPAIEFDDHNVTIRSGYGMLELQELGIKKIGIFEFTPTLAQVATQKELLQNANQLIADFEEADNGERPVIGKLNNKSDKKLFTQLFRHSSGLVVGEAHNSIASKKLLIDNMEMLRKKGVDTLFIEHLCADLHQNDLDTYLKSPPGSKIPQRLERYLKSQDNGQMTTRSIGMDMTADQYNELKKKYNFTELIKAAKEAGMNIVPIDTEASYSIYRAGAHSHNPTNRYKVMNYLASQKIREKSGTGKWIAFVGNAHASTCEGVPGVAELMGVPSLLVEDKATDNNPSVKVHVKNHHEILNPDVVLTLDATASQVKKPSFFSRLSQFFH